VGRRRHWVPFGAASLALAILLALNVMNPEALVVRRNLDHAEATGRFDVGYAASLSSDATPTLIAALPRLDAPSEAAILDAVCGAKPSRIGGLSWNRSRVRAAEACQTRT
ncbi:MAG TPA: DUF4153 domain-containing protein, partial [Actinomycetota bacterium]|nr:DUF4153 domain-containing protein [Actinomycetota bacterium]